jgi:acyl carrier protein
MDDTRSAVLDRLTAFFAAQSKDGDLRIPHDANLSELGVLNSVGMMRLIVFLREDLHVEVPSRDLTGRNFKTLNDITALVISVRNGTGTPAR